MYGTHLAAYAGLTVERLQAEVIEDFGLALTLAPVKYSCGPKGVSFRRAYHTVVERVTGY